jgi:hypothetical protein
MYDEIAMDDAINVVRILGDERAADPAATSARWRARPESSCITSTNWRSSWNGNELAVMASSAETREGQTDIGSRTEEMGAAVATFSPVAVCTPARRCTC